MRRSAAAFVILCLMVLCGCASQPKPSSDDVAAARQGNDYTRSIDKAQSVANEQSSREDDPALH